MSGLFFNIYFAQLCSWDIGALFDLSFRISMQLICLSAPPTPHPPPPAPAPTPLLKKKIFNLLFCVIMQSICLISFWPFIWNNYAPFISRSLCCRQLHTKLRYSTLPTTCDHHSKPLIWFIFPFPAVLLRSQISKNCIRWKQHELRGLNGSQRQGWWRRLSVFKGLPNFARGTSN